MLLLHPEEMAYSQPINLSVPSGIVRDRTAFSPHAEMSHAKSISSMGQNIALSDQKPFSGCKHHLLNIKERGLYIQQSTDLSVIIMSIFLNRTAVWELTSVSRLLLSYGSNLVSKWMSASVWLYLNKSQTASWMQTCLASFTSLLCWVLHPKSQWESNGTPMSIEWPHPLSLLMLKLLVSLAEIELKGLGAVVSNEHVYVQLQFIMKKWKVKVNYSWDGTTYEHYHSLIATSLFTSTMWENTQSGEWCMYALVYQF